MDCVGGIVGGVRVATLDSEFSPYRERSRHDALVERARRAPADRPLWLLCPRESLAEAFQLRIARAGGGFVRIVDWNQLASEIEERLGLPLQPMLQDTKRAWLLEQALMARAATDTPKLDTALRVDPYGIALAVLEVVDELRFAGWDGDDAVVDRVRQRRNDPVARLVCDHLELLGYLIRALERGLEETGALDMPARLRRIVRAPSGSVLLPTELLVVEGVDRLRPLERAVLECIADSGTRVDVAPWVLGWRRRAARPVDPSGRPRTALEAFSRVPEPVTAPDDDESIVEISASDPDEEAEGVARWLAEQDPSSRQDVAIMVPRESGYAPRIARALARYGLMASYRSSEPVCRTPLWQIVRASVRLAWWGPDAIDLSTVLSAPGSGIGGADRDRLCALLRERLPTSWKAVQELLFEATDPLSVLNITPAPSGDEGHQSVDGSQRIDAERARQLVEVRARVEEMIAMWAHGRPLAERDGNTRIEALRALVKETIQRFANPMRLRETFDDDRVVTAWTCAAQSMIEATEIALASMERHGSLARQNDPSVFLALVERLLGHVPDVSSPRRRDAVQMLVDTPFVAQRPGVLVVLGFQRGRYPATAGTPLLLGPLEREALNRASDLVPGLAELADEGTRATLLERDVRRALTLPTRTLVVVAPRRDAQGNAVEPSLTRRDLLASYPSDVALARARRGLVPIAQWCRTTTTASPRTSRALLCDLVEWVGQGDATRACTSLQNSPFASVALRDFIASRWRPDRSFRLGDLIRDWIATEDIPVTALETLLKCRYGFLFGSVLGLRSVPLARRPSLSLADHTSIAHAILRALDADPSGRSNVDSALDAALEIKAYGARAERALEAEDLRGTLKDFVERFVIVRRQWGLADSTVVAPKERQERTTTTIDIETRTPLAPKQIRVSGEPARVEIVSRDGARKAVLVQLRAGGVDKLAKQRQAGLGVATALLPVIAEKRHDVSVVAIAHLSLGKSEADVIARSDHQEMFRARAGRVAVMVDPDQSMERLRDEMLARLAQEIDAIADEQGEIAPHTPERRRQLEEVDARSCEYCAGRLACRFGWEVKT